jgi:hypothetical protein
MARYRAPLQDAIGVPVVEPTQAAVAMAIGRVRLGWHAQLAPALPTLVTAAGKTGRQAGSPDR